MESEFDITEITAEARSARTYCQTSVSFPLCLLDSVVLLGEQT